jgi:hypothetical protein
MTVHIVSYTADELYSDTSKTLTQLRAFMNSSISLRSSALSWVIHSDSVALVLADVRCRCKTARRSDAALMADTLVTVSAVASTEEQLATLRAEATGRAMPIRTRVDEGLDSET